MRLSLGLPLFLSYLCSQNHKFVLAHRRDHIQATFRAQKWSFSEKPAENSTDNFIFETVDSLLQHWPNTRYRNGHNVIPATVPIGTLLHHGTFSNEIPKIPEWTATDPEHAFLFCRSIVVNDTGCWQLTLVTTRPLKVLYFDGSSAAKMEGGPMDAQDIVAWGEIKPEWTFRERDRLTALCNWGQQFELDGFVRMEIGFEIMLCDFTVGVETVSLLHINPGDFDRPGRRYSDPLTVTSSFRTIEAGSWHNHFPGEPRINVDFERLITFYDTSLFPSLQAARSGHGRLKHRLLGISPTDVQQLQSRLKEVLQADMSPQNQLRGSGVDWKAISKVIKNRYSERIEILHYILNSTSGSTPEDNLKRAHRHITSFISPYILHSAVPGDTIASEEPHSWAAPVFEVCATTHTNYLHSANIRSKMTHSEHVLLSSVEGVTKEICRVLIGLWAEGFETIQASPDWKPAVNVEGVVGEWRSRVEALKAWLDWSSWLRCRPECSFEDLCYLPTWPYFVSPWPPGKPEKPNRPDDSGFLENEPGWLDPQPRCVRRVEFLNLNTEK